MIIESVDKMKGAQGTWTTEHPIRMTGGEKSKFIRHHSSWTVMSPTTIYVGLANRWCFPLGT